MFAQPEIEPDAAYYDMVAREVASGKLIRDDAFYLAPLYPYLLGGYYAVLDVVAPGLDQAGQRTAARYAQALLGALSVALIALLGWRLGGLLAAAVAGFLGAVYGFLVLSSGPLMATGVILLVNLCAMSWLVHTLRRPRRWRWVVGGVLLGLCVLAHGTGLMTVALVGALVLLTPGEVAWRGRAVRVALMLAGVAPWLALTAAHNLVAAGDFVLLTSNAGRNFYIGNNPTATGTFKFYVFGHSGSALGHFLLGETRDAGDLPPSEVSKRALGAALRFIANHPVRAAGLWLEKAGLFLHREELSTRYNLGFARTRSDVLRLCPVGFGVVAPLGLVGLAVAGWRGAGRRLLLAVFVGQLLAFMLTFVLGRYRIVAVACLLIAAGWLAEWVWSLVRERRWRAAGLTALGLVCAVALVHRPVEGLEPRRGWGIGWLHEAQVLLDRGEIERARAAFEKATTASFEPLENEPLWRANAWIGIAQTRERQGDPDGALEAYRQALRVTWENAPGRKRAWLRNHVNERMRRIEAKRDADSPAAHSGE
jgi:tetratricopeptide (TPR) repeat protein